MQVNGVECNSAASILQADYRLDGRETVIACAQDGEVRVGVDVAHAAHARSIITHAFFRDPFRRLGLFYMDACLIA